MVEIERGERVENGVEGQFPQEEEEDEEAIPEFIGKEEEEEEAVLVDVGVVEGNVK